jgi:hypothetical protein
MKWFKNLLIVRRIDSWLWNRKCKKAGLWPL